MADFVESLEAPNIPLMVEQSEPEQLTPVGPHVTIIMPVSSTLPVLLRMDMWFWTTAVREECQKKNKDIPKVSVLVVGSEGRDAVVTEDREMGTKKVAWEVRWNESLQEIASNRR